MKKEETLACDHPHGMDKHLPVASAGRSSFPYLQHIVEKGYIVMFLQVLYVLLSHVWRCSADFLAFGDDLEGLSFQCWESVLQ